MKIIIAPDSFKESLTAEEVAEAIKRGFQPMIADVDVSSALLVMGEKVQ